MNPVRSAGGHHGDEPLAFMEFPTYLQLRMFLWLPSQDVFRMGSNCRALTRLITKDGEQAKVFWHELSPEFGGAHRNDAIWLHPLANAAQIKSNVQQAPLFNVFGEVQFWSMDQILNLSALLSSVKAEQGLCFVGPCRFDRERLVQVIHGGGNIPARSNRISFDWQG